MGQRAWEGRKVVFAVVFTNITKRGALPEEASVHIVEMTAIKVALREENREEKNI